MNRTNRTKPRLRSPFKVFILLLYAIFGIGIFFVPAEKVNGVFQSGIITLPKVQTVTTDLDAFPIQIPTIRYGLAIDTFHVIEQKIASGEFLADILLPYQLSYPTIDSLVRKSKDIFDTRTLRAGKSYTLLFSDTTQRPEFFIYEPNIYKYIVFDLRDTLNVFAQERPVTKEVKMASGTIKDNLWNAMVGNGLDFELAVKMEMALQWSVDLNRLTQGSEFRLVYEQEFIEGEKAGIGQLQAAYFMDTNNEHFAIHFDGKEEQGYYNLLGKPMKKAFLKAPVRASRISSRYNLRRFHPILKRRRPHLGTDYAAPYGTPIYAVGNGVVTDARYTKGNGRFVKIHHNKTYQTQYLHMQRFATGIRPGVHVKQGQVIGYVGSTGLATGPHVCFRFWKNGRQVNHLNLNFPTAKPLPSAELPDFYKVRDHFMDLLGFPQNTIAELVSKVDTTFEDTSLFETAP